MTNKDSKQKENQENISKPEEVDETEKNDSKTEENVTNNSEIEEKLAEINDKYIRLTAEFDNYRKRTAREKLEILRNGGEEIIKGLLPILDDFDRSLESMEAAEDVPAVREGVVLIQTKLLNYLKSQGLSEIETTEQHLDTDLHDAVTKFPVDDENKKGKIIDVAQKGYKLNDKVIRFAKVIVGE